MENEKRHDNFSNTINRLLELNALPIINENDTVATEEIAIGDNDTLAAMVAQSIRADKLILLSDIDGVFTADPHTDPEAKLIHRIPAITDEVMALAGAAGSKLGTGGMVTKFHAAKICIDCGCEMVIANGNRPAALYDILEGKPVGTAFGEEVK